MTILVMVGYHPLDGGLSSLGWKVIINESRPLVWLNMTQFNCNFARFFTFPMLHGLCCLLHKLCGIGFTSYLVCCTGYMGSVVQAMWSVAQAVWACCTGYVE